MVRDIPVQRRCRTITRHARLGIGRHAHVTLLASGPNQAVDISVYRVVCGAAPASCEHCCASSCIFVPLPYFVNTFRRLCNRFGVSEEYSNSSERLVVPISIQPTAGDSKAQVNASQGPAQPRWPSPR